MGQQKLAVVWAMLSSDAGGQGEVSRVSGRGRCRRRGVGEKGPRRELGELCLGERGESGMDNCLRVQEGCRSSTAQ